MFLVRLPREEMMAKPGVEPQGVGPAHIVVPCEVLLLHFWDPHML